MHPFLEARVADYMTAQVVTIGPDTSMAEVERQLDSQDFNGLPVVEKGALLGMVTKFDVLKCFVFTPQAVVPDYAELTRRTAREIMTRDLLTVTPETPLTRVLQRLVDARVKSFPVVEGGVLVGIIAREDVVRALRELARA